MKPKNESKQNAGLYKSIENDYSVIRDRLFKLQMKLRDAGLTWYENEIYKARVMVDGVANDIRELK